MICTCIPADVSEHVIESLWNGTELPCPFKGGQGYNRSKPAGRDWICALACVFFFWFCLTKRLRRRLVAGYTLHRGLSPLNDRRDGGRPQCGKAACSMGRSPTVSVNLLLVVPIGITFNLLLAVPLLPESRVPLLQFGRVHRLHNRLGIVQVVLD